jgi:2-(1,2-epoxy-1,2-dihydrophenyl)acetyl-CoA isomerase
MGTSHDSPLLIEQAGGVLRLRFNRPRTLNAIDTDLAEAFRDACRAAAAMPGVRAVLLSGEGRAFMVGGDLGRLAEGGPDGADSLIIPLHESLGLLAALPVPVVAALHGAVAGAGLGVALAADLAIAADTTRLGFAYDRVGASPDAGTSWSLPRVLGLRRAMGLALLGDTIDAVEALRLGLVNRVVPAAALESEAVALVERLAAGPTLAYGRTKALLRAAFEQPFAAQLDAEHAAFRAGTTTADFAEGTAAFLEKRPPRFMGG